jgi:amino acid transporter
MATGSTPSTVTTAAPQLRRVLGAWDLTWLCVVAITNLNVVPVIASNGPVTTWLWLLALAFFFWPQGVAVIELAHCFPAEGGIYIWTKGTLGDFHGFMCGWCYWTTNMFYIPTLLFYLAGIPAYIGGKATANLSDSGVFFFLLTTGLLWLTVILNIRGMGVGKWINNLGGMGTMAATLVLIALGVSVMLRGGSGLKLSDFSFGGDYRLISSFGVICFGLVGLELGPVMGDEIRDPLHTVPKSVLYGGLLSGVLYVGATLSVLLSFPRRDVAVVQGVLQAVDKMTAGQNLGWILAPLAVLMSVAIAGSVSAWTAGTARIMFVSGLDRYLPAALGKIHPCYHTPHVALITQAGICTTLIAMSFIGAGVKDAYITLLDMAVVLQMLSYLYLFAALLAVVRRSKSTGAHLGRKKLWFAAISGLTATIIGLIVAFIPSHQINSIWIFESKMVICCTVFLGIAGALFRYYSRHRAPIIGPSSAT